MRVISKLFSASLAWLVWGVLLALASTSAFSQTPTVPPKVQVLKIPEGVTPTKHTAELGELIHLVGETGARWELDPAAAGLAKILADDKGNASFSASKPGVYFAVCYSPGGASWIQVEVIDNRNPDPRPQPQPQPGPAPEPTPIPATGPVKKFVVVENSLKAGQFRGDVMGSTTVQTYYKANGLIHRLLDINAQEGADAESQAFFKAAEGKELPWLWTYDAHGVQIASKKCPLTPEGFVAELGNKAPHKRAMGNRPPPQNKLKVAWKEFGASPNVPVIPRANWKPVSLEAFLPAVKDQDGVGACNAFATVTAVEVCRAQAGMPYVKLSPGYLYGNINGQRDDGSLLEDGLAWMTSKGTCKASTVPELAWKRSQWPATAAKEAEDYLVLEAYLCPNFDAVASAAQQGFTIIVGIQWFDNYTPDRDGWLPRGRGNWGGHAICSYGLTKRGNEWGMLTRNSWGESWGQNGNFVIPESAFGNVIGGYWAVRAVKQTGGTDFPVVPKISQLKAKPARVRDAGDAIALAW